MEITSDDGVEHQVLIEFKCSECGKSNPIINNTFIRTREDGLWEVVMNVECNDCHNVESVSAVEDSERSRVERAYLYDELPEEVQEKVYENYSDFNDDWASDVLHESVDYFLEEVGIKADRKRTYWSFDRDFYFYSEDMFFEDEKKFWESLPPRWKKQLDEVDPDNNLRSNYEMGFSTNHYSMGRGSNSPSFEATIDAMPEGMERETEEYDKFWEDTHKKEEKIQEILEDWWNDFYKDLLNKLRKEYEEDSSPENIAETMRANEYRFNMKGKIV